jgi:hypothetical protein
MRLTNIKRKRARKIETSLTDAWGVPEKRGPDVIRKPKIKRLTFLKITNLKICNYLLKLI